MRFLFKILTCSGNFAQRKQMVKYQIRKPTVRPVRQPRKSTVPGTPVTEPVQTVDLDKAVWELSVWNYSDIQRALFW
jgi:hypothetical protein